MLEHQGRTICGNEGLGIKDLIFIFYLKRLYKINFIQGIIHINFCTGNAMQINMGNFIKNHGNKVKFHSKYI